jgi:hypothetical protein
MMTERSRGLGVTMCVAVLFGVLSGAATAAAQVGLPGMESADPAGPTPAVVDPETCRTDLVAVMQDYAQIADLAKDDSIRAIAGAAITRLGQLSSQDLARLAGNCAGVEQWHAAIQRALQTATTQKPAPAPALLTSAFPEAEYSSICGSVRPDPGVIYGVMLARDAAEGFWAGLDRACNETVVVAGEGGNTSLACVAADLTRLAAEAALEALQFCLDDVNAAEIGASYLREDYVHLQVEEVDTKVDDLTTRIGQVEDVLQALTAAVDSLRTQNCEVIRLLNTPEGWRRSSIPACMDQPGYPYRFPHKHHEDHHEDHHESPGKSPHKD